MNSLMDKLCFSKMKQYKYFSASRAYHSDKTLHLRQYLHHQIKPNTIITKHTLHLKQLQQLRSRHLNQRFQSMRLCLSQSLHLHLLQP